MSMTSTPIMILRPSRARRVLAIGFIGIFGILCVVAALLGPVRGAGWTVALLVVGLAAFWSGMRLVRATRTWIELHEHDLRDGEGRILARLDEIHSVSRAAFAIKPSNGFVVLLLTPGTRVWEPGLWWRFGRRLGVGGVTPNIQSRAMADTLTAMIEERRSRHKG